MEEYVSLQTVLDIASQYCPDDDGSCSKVDVDLREMLDEIEALPTVEVQPVKYGKWIWVEDYRDCEGDIYSQYKCSCCDFCVGGVYSVKDLTHFCGECGAKMDGDANVEASTEAQKSREQ